MPGRQCSLVWGNVEQTNYDTKERAHRRFTRGNKAHLKARKEREGNTHKDKLIWGFSHFLGFGLFLEIACRAHIGMETSMTCNY